MKTCVCLDTGYLPGLNLKTKQFIQLPCINCEKGNECKKLLESETEEERETRLKKFQEYAKTQPLGCTWRNWTALEEWEANKPIEKVKVYCIDCKYFDYEKFNFFKNGTDYLCDYLFTPLPYSNYLQEKNFNIPFNLRPCCSNEYNDCKGYEPK
jgi:hypothetical protein